MLTKADNELLVRTGPKTPMGELFRRFWTPIMLASELRGANSAPLRVRILGEDLIAFRDSQVRTTSYPAMERGGLIWAFMGPLDVMPEFPAIEAFAVPDDHRSITKMVVRGNYAQFMEGDVDSSHVSFLHSRQDGKPIPGGRVDAA